MLTDYEQMQKCISDGLVGMGLGDVVITDVVSNFNPTNSDSSLSITFVTKPQQQEGILDRTVTEVHESLDKLADGTLRVNERVAEMIEKRDDAIRDLWVFGDTTKVHMHQLLTIVEGFIKSCEENNIEITKDMESLIRESIDNAKRTTNRFVDCTVKVRDVTPSAIKTYGDDNT